MDTRHIAFAILQAANRRRWLRRPFEAAMTPLNPFDHARHIDPYPLYDRARQRGPIFRHRATGMWMVVGHQAAVEVLRGPVSVERGRALRASAPYKHMTRANFDVLTSGILMRDGSDHDRLRRLVSRSFTPRAVADLGRSIESLTERLLAELETNADPGSGAVEVMAGLAEPVPVHVISELLGIPQDQRSLITSLSDVVARFVEPFGRFDPQVMDRAVDQLRDLFGDLAHQRRAAPRSDLISALVAPRNHDDRLEGDELLAMVVLLLIAGHETTSGLIGNAVLALVRNPEARDRLIEQPELAAGAVEELLRYDSPVQATDRTVLEDFRVGGERLRAGELVLVFLGAANRDPVHHPRPGRLDLGRRNPRPLAFGHGAHHCVGAALTRLEASIVLPAFVRAFPCYSIDEAGVAWRRSATLRGPSRLPVLLHGPLSGGRSPQRPEPQVAAAAG